jgi:hypothetical protein
MTTSMIVAFLAALALATGCEDSTVAGKDSTMVLVASPSTVQVDPAADPPTDTTTIVATILSVTGFPAKGIKVFFGATGGVLDPENVGVITNSDGLAAVQLTVGADDPAEITVTATSASLTKTVVVKKTTVGTDFTMNLVASPSTVLIDPAHGINSAVTSIVATILDPAGVPQQGRTVFFSNTGGVLAPVNGEVVTDIHGFATVTLTVGADDAAELVVTASSGNLLKTAFVKKTTVPTNHPPIAVIVATPRDQQVSGRAVAFDGSSSSDEDTGDFITQYKWDITSTAPDTGRANPFHVEGPGVSGVSFPSDSDPRPFTNVQDLTVTLSVASGVPLVWSSEVTIIYHIVCNNTKPTAVIAGAATQQIFGAPFASVNFLLDGTLSFDLETPIDSYTWNCGNGSIAIPQTPPSKAVCKYTVDQTSRTYTATLQVSDKGTGPIDPITGTYPIDPNTGTYLCQMDSVPASVQVVVSPLAGGGP